MNRPLSQGEHMIWLVDQAIPQNAVVIGRFSRPSGPFENLEHLLRESLDSIQEKYPPLRCKFKKGDVPGFVSGDVPKIPVRILERKNEEHWVEIAEEEMQIPFPWTTGPLVRVVLLCSKDVYELLVIMCHVVADGISGVTILKNLLNNLDVLSRGEIIVKEPPQPDLPSIVDLLRKNLKYKPEFFDIKGRINRFLHKSVELKGDADVPPEKRITRVIQRNLSENDTQKLVAFCKKEKTTVHAAVCAAFLQELVHRIRQQQGVPPKKSLMIGCLSPVNIRHLLESIGEEIGNFISDALHYQLIHDQSSLWVSARKVKKALERELKFGRHIKALRNLFGGLTSNLSPIEILTTTYKVCPPFAVTNMGKLDIPLRFGTITLEGFHFTGAISPAARNGFAIGAVTFRGRMTLNFFYSEPYLSRERVNLMIEGIMGRLNEAIK